MNVRTDFGYELYGIGDRPFPATNTRPRTVTDPAQDGWHVSYSSEFTDPSRAQDHSRCNWVRASDTRSREQVVTLNVYRFANLASSVPIKHPELDGRTFTAPTRAQAQLDASRAAYEAGVLFVMVYGDEDVEEVFS